MRPDLREARSKAGLTQAELGEKIGRDQATVSRYESGGFDVDKDIAPAIAKALGMDLLDVLYPKKPSSTKRKAA